MDVKGEHQFEVSAQQLWNYLMDMDVLAKITPGVSKLELIEDDKYKTVSEIKIGPVKGSFKGNLEVVDKVEPDSFAIVMEQLSKIGNAHVKVDMKILSNGDAASALNFDGKAKLSGVIARTGQRVLSGVANTITKEVFASLEAHIQEDKKSNPVVNEAVVNEPVIHEPAVNEPIAAESVVSETVVSSPAIEEQVSMKAIEEKIEVETTQEPATQSASSNNTSSIAADANEAIAKVKTEVKEAVAEKIDATVSNTNNTGGLFNSIINFFKRLFS